MKICRFSAAKIEDLYFKDMHNNQINTNQKLVTFL